MTPDNEAPTSWLAEDATATGAGTPIKISKGVKRNPPPTPNTPDKKPTAAPSPSRTKTSIETSAIGR